MTIRLWAAMPLSICLATPVAAQDVYENAITDHARVLTDSAILKRNLEYARKRQNSAPAAGGNEARKAQACADRERFSREYGANHPKVRQLYALCARAGYR